MRKLFAILCLCVFAFGFMAGEKRIVGARVNNQVMLLRVDLANYAMDCSIDGTNWNAISGTGEAIIADNSLTLAKLVQIPAGAILGNVSGSTGNVTTLSASDLKTLIGDATTSISGLMSSTDKSHLDGLPTSAIAAPASPAQGDILYYSGSAWSKLAAGTSGQYLKTQGTGANPIWSTVSGGGGSGDVTGPASSTDNHLAAFDGTTGKIIKDSGVLASGFATSGANSNITSLTGLTTPLSVTQGGTGLSALGTAGQVLTVNSSATGLEFATSSGGGLLIASGSGYALSNGSTGRGTVGSQSVSLEYSNSGSTYGATGSNATVSGGFGNTAGAYCSSVAGGSGNSASFDYSAIGGGKSNSTGNTYAFVGGGKSNSASNEYTTVSGGESNTASGSNSTVSGGSQNIANIGYATIGGGYSNSASGPSSTISGGHDNTASYDYATVSGGKSNIAGGGYASTVSGGFYNTANGAYSSVSGGFNGMASKYGEWAYASGKFSAAGDCQRGSVQARKATSSTSEAILYLGDSSEKFTLSSGDHYSCRIHLIGAQADGSTGDYYAMVKIKNVGGTTSLSGTVRVLEAWEGDTNLGTPTISITADNTNYALQIAVTPANATATRWSATIEYIKINY